MSDERSFLNLPDFWNDCDDHFPRPGGIGEAKQREEVDFIQHLLQSGQSFSSGRTAFAEPPYQPQSPDISSEESRSIPDQQLVKPSVVAAPIPAQVSAVVEVPQVPKPSTGNSKALKHKCDTCSQVFDSKIALSIHTGRIHKHEGKDKNYQCTHCSKAFFNSSYLAQHMRIHTGQKPYPCPDCDKRFTQLSHLQQHKRTHTGEKPYRCQQPGCTKAFSQLSNLQSHTRSHLDNGTVHKCTSCYKCYFDEASLNAHLRTHMVNKRVRNYRCEECGKSYTQDTYLQNHINNKHGGNSGDAYSYVVKPTKQPTSIQAATSMICKLEDAASNCGMQPPMPQNQHHSALGKLMAPLGHSFSHETPYDLPRMMPSAFNTAGVVERPSYQENSSAFKPVRPSYDGLDSLPPSSRESGIPRQISARGYDQQTSMQDGLALINHLDTKSNMDAEQQDDRYWRFRNNMASLSGYSTQLQNYMASQANYHPSYAAYINNPLDSIHSEKGNMYNNGDAMSDYLMGGGLREAYQLD